MQTEGKTYADLCAKQLDGVTCEPSFRGVTRFWSDFAAYEVRRAGMRVVSGCGHLGRFVIEVSFSKCYVGHVCASKYW